MRPNDIGAPVRVGQGVVLDQRDNVASGFGHGARTEHVVVLATASGFARALYAARRDELYAG